MARRSDGASARPPQVDAPGGRLDEAHGEAEQRGLAGAVRPDDDGRRAGGEREIDPVEDRHAAHDERNIFEAGSAGW